MNRNAIELVVMGVGSGLSFGALPWPFFSIGLKIRFFGGLPIRLSFFFGWGGWGGGEMGDLA